MARKEGAQWVASDGTRWNDAGSAGNADRAFNARGGYHNASEDLINGAGKTLSDIGNAITSVLDARLEAKFAKLEREQYLKKGGAEFEEGQRLERRGEYDAAIESYKKAVDKGLITALYDIAVCYRDGKKIDTAAFVYFKKAADTARDDTTRKHIKRVNDKITDNSNVLAYIDTAVCYRDGIGTAQDYSQAFAYFKKAVDAEYPDDRAFFDLAVCYRDGLGVEKNMAMAVEYFNKLLAYIEGYEAGFVFQGLGIGDVLNYLGLCYRDGGPGLEADRDTAIKYFKKAANEGCAEGNANLAAMGITYNTAVRAAEGAGNLLSLIGGIAGAFGITLFVNRLFVKISGADRLPIIVTLVLMVVFSIVSVKAIRAKNKLALILAAVAAFGWLNLLGIIP